MMIVDMHGHAFMDFESSLHLRDRDKYPLPKGTDTIPTMVEQMDKCSIDKRVLLATKGVLDSRWGYEKADSSPQSTKSASFEWIREAMRRHPDRFIGFTCLNPAAKGAIEELEKDVLDYKFKGVKLFPLRHHFEVNDKRIYPFYQKCAELGVPVAFHMGWEPFSTDYLRLTNPLPLDDTATDFPNLKIIICHMGGGWFQEATWVALKHPTVYLDTSALHFYCGMMINPTEPSMLIKQAVRILGDSRILYGTDNTEYIMNLAFIEGLDLGDESTLKIMGENAAELLGIPLEKRPRKTMGSLRTQVRQQVLEKGAPL